MMAEQLIAEQSQEEQVVEVKKPALTAHQMLVLNSIIGHALCNPELAADFFVNPRSQLLTYNLTEDEILNISNYFNLVRELVEKNIKTDWY